MLTNYVTSVKIITSDCFSCYISSWCGFNFLQLTLPWSITNHHRIKVISVHNSFNYTRFLFELQHSVERYYFQFVELWIENIFLWDSCYGIADTVVMFCLFIIRVTDILFGDLFFPLYHIIPCKIFSFEKWYTNGI